MTANMDTPAPPTSKRPDVSFLCFIELDDEWPVIESAIDPVRAAFVPLTEPVRGILRKKGLRIVDLGQLFGSQSHLRVAAALRRMVPPRERADTDSGSKIGSHTFNQHVRALVNYALFIAEVSIAASRLFPGVTLVAARRRFVPSMTGEMEVRTQSVLADVVEAVGVRQQIQTRILPLARRHRNPARTGPWTAKSLRLVNRLLVGRWKGRRIVAVPTLSYGMRNLAESLAAHGVRIVVIRDGTLDGLKGLAIALWSLLPVWLRKPLRTESPAILGFLSVPCPELAITRWKRTADGYLQTRYVYRGVQLGRALRAKLESDIPVAAARCEALLEPFSRTLEDLAPQGVVSQMARTGDALALGAAALSQNIEAVLISHGSHVRPRNAVEAYEFGIHADGLLFSSSYSTSVVQSPSAEEALSALSPETSFVRTRPIMWGYRRANLPPPVTDEPIVLHAGTPKPSWAMRPWWYETMDEYIGGIIDLIRAVEALPNGHLIVRYRPTHGTSAEVLRERLPASDRFTLRTEGAFLDDLARSTVLASFSSTTIEEALHAGRPVLQYGGNGRYRHLDGFVWGSGRPVRSAVYSVSSATDLEPALSWILDQHRGTGLTTDEARKYVFGDGDDALSIEEFARSFVVPDQFRAKVIEGRAGTPDMVGTRT